MLFSKTQSLYKRLEGAVALKDRNKKMKKRVSKANGCLFTEGKKKAGLHPMQIVFSGLEMARICGERYINQNGEICAF